jgi:hypothetical protein
MCVVIDIVWPIAEAVHFNFSALGDLIELVLFALCYILAFYNSVSSTSQNPISKFCCNKASPKEAKLHV